MGENGGNSEEQSENPSLRTFICNSFKKLHQIYKGLSSNVVREAFGWNEEFVVPKPDEYPQSPGMASGADR